MENASFEQALAVVKALPAVDKRRLQQWLTEDERAQFNASTNGEAKLAYPREREMRWLSEHRREYIGQWVALDGDRLISHDEDLGKVFDEAHAQGIASPFTAFIEDPAQPSMGGW